MVGKVRIQRSIPTIIILLIFVSTCYALDNPAFFKGFRHMSKRKWDEAIMYFNISIKRQPDYLVAYSQLASCYERKRDFIKAKETWQKYTEFDSYFKDAVITHIELIDDYLKINELSPEEVIITLENIIENDKYPSSVLFLYAAESLSQLYFDNKLYIKAIPILDKIVLYYPQDATEETLFKLAYSHQKEEEYQKALDTYKKLDKEFKLTSDYIDKCKNLASLCYEALGDEAFAVDEWDKAKENYLFAIKGFSDAENIPRVRQKELKVQEQLAFVYKTEGDSSVMEKNYSKAIEFYQKVVGECPQSSQHRYAFTKIKQLNKLERQLFAKAREARSNKRYEGAIECYKNIIDHFPESRETPWAKFRLGMNYAAMGNFRQAVRVLLTMAREHPDHSWADIALERAGVYYWHMLGNEELAGKIFRYIVRKYPDGRATDNALYYLGAMYIAKEDFARSYRMLKVLVEHFPESNLLQRARLGMKHAMEEGRKKMEAKR